MTISYVIPGLTGNLMIERNMEEKFDYAKAVAELEKIAAEVEDPATKLDDIDALVARSNGLLKACRAYLRTVKERIDKLDEEIGKNCTKPTLT